MNKNIFKLFAVLTIASALLTGCSDKPSRTGNDPSIIASKPTEEHYIISEQAPKVPDKTLKSEDGTVYKTLTVEEIKVTPKARVDKPAADKIEETFDEAAKRHILVYDESLEAIPETPAELLPIETTVNYTTLRNDGRAISIREDIAVFNAGAQVSASAFIYNFDPITGKQILTDIFYTAGDKDSLDQADNKMFEKLVAKYGAESIKYESLNNASYVDAAQDTWYFTDGGIKVYFAAGEIADASLGALEIEYTKDELPEFSQKYFN